MANRVVMMLAGVAVLLLTGKTCAVSVPPPIKVSLTTKYITTEVQTVEQDSQVVLVGNLCGGFQNMAVNVSVLLNNNPTWDPALGVLRYYVVDAEDKTQTSALCTNVAGSAVSPNCIIKTWPSINNMYIKMTAGGVSAISFSLDAEFFSLASDEAAHIRAVAPVVRKPDLKVFETSAVRDVDAPLVYLTEIVTVAVAQSLVYHRTALLNFSFCPTPQTGSRYEVRGTVTATDGESSYAQYICKKLPCAVDGDNIIAHNGRQLPSNTVTTESGQWGSLYALIVCWGGVYDPAKDQYIGHYVFTAEQV